MASSTTTTSNQHDDIAKLSHEVLDVEGIAREVHSNQSGALVTFVGTTRDRFEGKAVIRLEYEAYEALAIKTIQDILKDAHNLGQDKIRCAVHHRLGDVPVGETSIVVAVSSPHRKQAFVTCEYILEQVKLRAQIWKREWYSGEEESEASWKQNFPPA